MNNIEWAAITLSTASILGTFAIAFIAGLRMDSMSAQLRCTNAKLSVLQEVQNMLIREWSKEDEDEDAPLIDEPQ